MSGGKSMEHKLETYTGGVLQAERVLPRYRCSVTFLNNIILP